MKKSNFKQRKTPKIRIKKTKLPSALAWISTIGVFVTAGLAVRSTIKAAERVRKAEVQYGRKLTNAEVLKTSAPAFVSTFIAGGTTIACIFTGDQVHIRRELAIGSAYSMMSQAYQEYRKEVIETRGDDADKQALANVRAAEIAELDIPKPDGEKRLFYEEISGHYFEATMLEVVDAEYHFNRNYWLRGGYGTLNEFYEFLGIPQTQAGAVLGWSNWKGEAFYGYTWVDFEHTLTTLDDGLECYIISYPFIPTADYEDDFDY